MTMRELCEDVAGGLRDGPQIKALQIGGPLGGILPASLLDTRVRLRAARRGRLHGRPRQHRRLRRARPTCATSPATCCASAPTRAAASASPAGSACAAPTRMFAADAPVDRARFEELLEALELRQPLRPRRRHAGADPQPARATSPTSWGCERDARVTIDGTDGRGRRRAATILEAADAAGALGADALLRRAPGPVRRLPRLPGRRRRLAPKPLPACTTPCRDGMEIDTEDADRAAGSLDAVVELVLSELPDAPAPAHRARAGRRAARGRRAPLAAAPRTRSHDDLRHPYLAFQHELCISCGRCVRACDEVQGAFALTATGRGFDANVTAGLDAGFQDSTCVACGACADTCPTDAITEITPVDNLSGKGADAWRRRPSPECTDDAPSGSTAPAPPPAATAASAAG